MRHKQSKVTRRAKGPKTPYDRYGNPNPMWIVENKNNINSHATYIVDPRGNGTFCHSTITYPNDPTRYHYGFEVNNRYHRSLGMHAWTTPYKDDKKITPRILNELKSLYRELCNREENISSRDNISLQRHTSKKNSTKKISRENRSRSRR